MAARALVAVVAVVAVVATAAQAATTITLAPSANPVAPGNSVTFTVDLVGISPAGTVAFLAGATTLCPAAAVATTGATGRATCTTGALSVGDHTITAHYSGDADDAAASSAPLAFWVATACRAGTSPVMAMPAVTSLRSYGAGLRSVARLAVDTAGNVLIADGNAGEIVTRATNGAVTARVRGLGNPVSIGVAEGTAARRYVGDAVAGRVSAYDSDWNPLFDLGGGADEFGLPGDIAVDATNGEVFVVDTARHEVRVYDGATGAYRRTIGRFGRADAQFFAPTGIVLDGSELLVADQMNYRVQALDKATGDFRYCLGTYSQSGFISGGSGPSRTYGMVQGLGIDTAGRLYVVDAFHGRVNIIERSSGARIGTIGAFGEGRAELRVPTDLVIDGNGRLFVASANDAKLEVWGLDAYTDPETVTTADVVLMPPMLDRNTPPPVARMRLELPNERPADVDRLSVRINGLTPSTFTLGDADFNGQPDLLLDLDPLALIATLDAGSSLVTVTGQVNGLDFRAQASITVTAVPVATTTTLTGTPNPAAAGAAVTLTATVTGLSPTGTTVIKNGTVPVCTTHALSGSSASCSVSSLPAGVHNLTAEYPGDADDAASASVPFELIVGPVTSAISLLSSSNPSPAATPVVLTATVTGTGPRGTVDFLDGADLLCSSEPVVPTSVATSTATCSTSSLAIGSHEIIAAYSGDVSNTAAVSPSLAQMVNRASSSVTLASSPNPSKKKEMVTFTATVRGVNPTGGVSFMEGTRTLCGAVALGSPSDSPRTAVCQIADFAKGKHSITAAYSGDAANAPVTSAPLIQSVTPGGKTRERGAVTEASSSAADATNASALDKQAAPATPAESPATPIWTLQEEALAALMLLLAGLGMAALRGPPGRTKHQGSEQ